MIYIIGVDHKIQHGGYGQANEAQRLLFYKYLEETVKKLDIRIIAEESNEEVLSMAMVKNCVARDISNKFKIQHIFCEPTKCERRELGIPNENKICELLGIDILRLSREDKGKIKEKYEEYFPIREKFWFEQISNYRRQKILMIIGSGHTSSFPEILRKNDCDYKIVNVNWCYEMRSVLN